MTDVSASGFSIALIANKTFPASTIMTHFADDADPFDIPDTVAAEVAMDVNGNLVSWSTPTPQEIVIALLPGSEEEKNLSILLEANTAKRGRRPAGDIITMVAMYPDGSVVTARNGKILSGSRGVGVSSGGRLKTKTYTFAFQDFDVVRA